RAIGHSVLTSNANTRDNVLQIEQATTSYKRNDLQKVIRENLKPVNHPYYTKYKPLQALCLQILRHDKTTFGADKNKIHGLLFDGAWLWEEYLNTILKNDFIHPENKTGKYKHHLFENFQPIYPDFLSKETKNRMVGDAKYIPLRKQQEYAENSERATSIYYKTITYMYRFNSKNAFLIYPSNKAENEEYKIKDTKGVLLKIGFEVPQTTTSFSCFQTEIQESEKAIIGELQ
ncbi:MAG: McrC family protein, partial [Dysgonamonadaceae bacterium]|nr:McrC family protein [Dysgonamonadaceae bacterium]